MEENIKTEQSLNLDEEQLQDVTGGAGPDPVLQHYLDKANNHLAASEMARAQGKPYTATVLGHAANDALDVIHNDFEHAKSPAQRRAEAGPSSPTPTPKPNKIPHWLCPSCMR